VITAGLVASAARLVDHVATVVLDEDLEGVHQARVGIRRLRSDLRTAAPLLDTRFVSPLRRELGWLMDSLGEVRDLDVLLARLRIDVETLDGADRVGADTVLAQAGDDRANAYEQLRRDLRSPRCAVLLEEMTRIATAPPFTGRAAKRPASKALPGLVRKPLNDLFHQARKRHDPPDDESLHRLRIAVKRVRYAVELAAPVVGTKARRAAQGLADVQDLLGEHNDACVAVTRLRTLGERTGPAGAWASGLLGGLQLAHSAQCRERFPAAWAKAAAQSRWRWVH
jgi:CHAD domain-containing protein